MRNFQLISLFLLLLLQPVYGGGKRAAKLKYNKYLIGQLEEGALLVRLKTKQAAYDKLIERGEYDLAVNVVEKQKQTNKLIISAFREYFNFCPVYFFTSDQSNLVKNKELDKVRFVNKLLKADSLLRPKNNSFLTAEFGTVARDTVSFYDRNYFQVTGEGTEKRQRVYGAPTAGYSGLVVKNTEFGRIGKPFPFVIRLNSMNPSKKEIDYAVEKLNSKLYRFSSRMSKFAL